MFLVFRTPRTPYSKKSSFGEGPGVYMWYLGVYLYDTYQRLCLTPTATDTVARVLYICATNIS